MNSHLRQTISNPKRLVHLVCFMACAVPITPIKAASFDCAKASTNVEKIICATKDLQILDEKLAETYKQALETSADKSSLIHAQVAWLKDRNACTTAPCIRGFYNKRIFSLQYPGIADIDKKPHEIRRALNTINLVPAFGVTNPICGSFLRDFREQKNIEHIPPTVRSSRYDDPVFDDYKKACPDIPYNKHVSVGGGRPDASAGLFLMEKEGRAFDGDSSDGAVLSINYGVKNFQFWDSSSRKNSDLKDVVIYYDEWKHKRGFLAGSWMGDYQLVRLDNCSSLPVGAGSLEEAGIIRYSGRTMIYSLFVSDQSRLYLYSFEKNQKGDLETRQLCAFNQAPTPP